MTGIGSVGIGGPASLGNGSIRPSAFSSVRGGTIEFRRWSTSERCTARRRFVWPGSWSAIAPSTQTTIRPTTAPTSTPAAESSWRTVGASRLRTAAPRELPTTSKVTASVTAPASASTGA